VGYFPDFEVGAKRRLSQRFGIIGWAWRLDKSLGRGNGKYTTEELIRNYGMLPNEAIQISRHNPSDLCIVLRNKSDGNRKLGVLFIDGTQPNKFGFDDLKDGVLASSIANALELEAAVAALADAVARAILPLQLPKLDLTRTAV
jgi:hypothetical protein